MAVKTKTTVETTPEPQTVISTKPPHRTWRRVSIGVFGIVILYIVWRLAVNHLYSLPQQSIAAFASLTSALFYTISVIVIFIVTGLTFFSWTASSTIASSVIQQLSGSQKTDPKKKDDDE